MSSSQVREGVGEGEGVGEEQLSGERECVLQEEESWAVEAIYCSTPRERAGELPLPVRKDGPGGARLH